MNAGNNCSLKQAVWKPTRKGVILYLNQFGTQALVWEILMEELLHNSSHDAVWLYCEGASQTNQAQGYSIFWKGNYRKIRKCRLESAKWHHFKRPDKTCSTIQEKKKTTKKGKRKNKTNHWSGLEKCLCDSVGKLKKLLQQGEGWHFNNEQWKSDFPKRNRT